MGWLSKYKSCIPGIRFNIVVHSSTRPAINTKGTVTVEEVEPGIWTIHSLDRIDHFSFTNAQNTNIKEIEVITKDVTSLKDAFKGLPNLESIHFHGPENFRIVDSAFKDTPKLKEITGLGWGTIHSSANAFENSGITEFTPPPSSIFNLQNTKEMFKNAVNLKKVTDFSEVTPTQMSGMFEGTKALEFITGLNTTKATDNLRDLFAGSSVKVPNSVEQGKLIGPGGNKFFTQDFYPKFEVKIEMNDPTDPQPTIVTKPIDSTITEKTTTGFTFKSWEPVDNFRFYKTSKKDYREHNTIKKCEIVKADLKSLDDSFGRMSEVIIPNNTIKNVTSMISTFSNWKGSHLDLTHLDVSNVTTVRNCFMSAELVSLMLPEFNNVTDASGVVSQCKKLEYVNQLHFQSGVSAVAAFAGSDNIVAPNKYQIQDWKTNHYKTPLKATIPYPFVAIGTLRVTNPHGLAIGDSKGRPAPGVQVKNSKWEKIKLTDQSFDHAKTGFFNFDALTATGTKEIRFLYPVDFVYLNAGNDVKLADPNLTKFRVVMSSGTVSGSDLTKVEINASKLNNVVLRDQQKLEEVSIDSDSLTDATSMFTSSGPLTHLNIPTENLVTVEAMFYLSTIKSLKNFVFPKVKNAKNFAYRCTNLTDGAQFPSDSLLNIYQIYATCPNLKDAGLLKTKNCVDFSRAFINTPKLLCLKELDTRKAPADKRKDIFGPGTKIVNPTSAEQTKLKNGFVYVNKTPCPILEQVINLPQQSKRFNLDTFIRSKLQAGVKKVKVVNGLTQPTIYSGGLAGLDVTLVNSGSIQADKESGTGLIIQAPMTLINTGTIYGGGGHGGNGGAGVPGKAGATGHPGGAGSTGPTTPAVKGRKAVAAVAAVKDRIIRTRYLIKGPWVEKKIDKQIHWPSSSHGWLHIYRGHAFSIPIPGGWVKGMPSGNGWNAWFLIGGVPSNVVGGHGSIAFTVQSRNDMVSYHLSAGTYTTYKNVNHPATYGYHTRTIKGHPAVKAVTGITAKPAIPGCPGGKGGVGGPGGKAGTAGKRSGTKGVNGDGGLGGHGQYWRHPPIITPIMNPIAGGKGTASATSWTGKAGHNSVCLKGSKGKPGSKGADGRRGAPGTDGTRSGRGGKGGTWGKPGNPGEKGVPNVRYSPTAVGPAGKAIEGSHFLTTKSTGLSGAHVAGAVT